MSVLYICAIAAFSQNIETDYYLYFVKNTTFFCHIAFADDVFSVISMTFLFSPLPAFFAFSVFPYYQCRVCASMVDNMAFHFPENVSFCRRNDFFMRMEYEKMTYCIFAN